MDEVLRYMTLWQQSRRRFPSWQNIGPNFDALLDQWSASLAGQVRVWIVILSACGIVLHGRFDWSPQAERSAQLGYVLSFFYLAFMVPATYYACAILLRRRRVAALICALQVLLYSFPFNTFGLQVLRYSEDTRPWTDPSVASTTQIVWFPFALQTSTFLIDFAILAIAYAFIALVGWAVYRLRKPTSKIWFTAFYAVLALLFIQTTLHSNLRSPYTYTGHFEPGHTVAYWYHLYLLEDGRGAVNADEGQFIVLDNVFRGVGDTSNPLLLYRRTFVHYLASPFTYFFSAYDVFLILNPLLWLAAVFCMYDVVVRITSSRSIALYSAALTACGNGFIYFVAQPMSYLANFSSVIIAVFVFERLASDERGYWKLHWGRALICGVALGLISLTYDFFNAFPMLVLFAVFRRKSVLDALIACTCALVMFASYFVLYLRVLQQPDSIGNSSLATGALAGLATTVGNFALGDFYVKTVGLLSSYMASLSFAFMVLALLFALLGIVSSRDNASKTFVCLMLLPSILLSAYLYYGNVMWGAIPLSTLPRLSYIAYPGIYVAAAMGFVVIQRSLGTWRYARATPWLLIAALAIWQNADVIGAPSLQYHFYWPVASPAADRIAP